MQRYKSKYTGPQMDVAFERALPYAASRTYGPGASVVHGGYLWVNTSGASTTGVEPGANYNVWNVTHCNPNLLDNGDFGNAVNQRGKTVYTLSPGYCIDRWKEWGTFAINEGFITHSSNFEYFRIEQRFENYKDMIGKTFTFSIIAKRGTSNYVRVVFFKDNASFIAGTDTTKAITGTDWEILSFTLTIPENESISTALDLFVYTSPQQGGGSLDIKNTKLELGAISTIANDPPANREAEKWKCKQYFNLWETEAARTSALLESGAMRTTPVLSTIDIGGVTYYTAIADL